MVCACHFINSLDRQARLSGTDVASGLGHTSKGLPEATIGCEVLLRRLSGRWALQDLSQLSC